MNIKELEHELKTFLKANIPPVVFKEDLHIVVRRQRIIVLKSNQLTIGDIRLLQLPAVDMVKGLSPTQWSTLMQKCITLRTFGEFVFV